MTTCLSADFETRSVVDLRKCGAYIYAESPTTEILVLAYAFDEEEPELWVPGDTVPERLAEYVRDGLPLRAHNAMFERLIWKHILTPRHRFPEPTLEQWHCTAAEAAAMSLPRALDQCSKVLGLQMQKDNEGYKIMMRLCRPRKAWKGEAPGIYWHDSPEEREKLNAYCAQDVRVERAISKRIRRLSPAERDVYLLDQKINDRGVQVDLPLVHAAQIIVDEGMRRANKEMNEITDGAATVTTPQAIRMWAQAAGVEMDDLRKDTVRDFLAGEAGVLPDDVRRVLELRADAGKTSNAKLGAMVQATCRDSRSRGLLLYHAAGTGRWGGKLIQPQNFARPVVKGPERFITRVMENEYDLIEMEAPALAVISSMLRSMLVAASGKQFFAGDFAQIEARVVAWLFQQEDLVQLFASGGKVYETMAAYVFGVPVEDVIREHEQGNSFMRNVGKAIVLGCGFQMGGKTFQRQAKVQAGLDLSDEIAKAGVDGYRTLYPLIKQGWREINNAALNAVRASGAVFDCGRNGCTKFTKRGPWLYCVLPSGRVLSYALPKLEVRTITPEDGDSFTVECVTFAGVNGVTRKWERFAGYGGMWTNNVVQATARDLMAAAMLRLEEAGYPVVCTIHDEVLAEREGGSLDEYLKVMKQIPKWASGLPVAVDGWRGQRFRKG